MLETGSKVECTIGLQRNGFWKSMINLRSELFPNNNVLIQNDIT